MQIAVATQELAARQAAIEAAREAYEQDLSAREASLQDQASKMNFTLETLELLQLQTRLQAQLQAQVHAQLLPKSWFKSFFLYGSLFLLLLAVLMIVPAASSRAQMP